MDLRRVEIELRKRLDHPYRWGRKQSNDWDAKTRFIYNTYSFRSLLEQTQTYSPELKDYALNRWYNYWSAMAAENIFAAHSEVQAHKNRYDKLVDFSISGIPFDHKTSIFPKAFNHSFDYAVGHKSELIQWLYKHQSQEGRHHMANRLFIVLYDDLTSEHWKLKAEIFLLKGAIDKYVNAFLAKDLMKLNFGEGEVLSDIIWVKKSDF